MAEGIIIAFIAGIVELSILWQLLKLYFISKELIPNKEKFKESLQSSLSNRVTSNHYNIMMFELCDLIGSQRSPFEIRVIIKNYVTSLNDKISHLANLGPAIGLFSTFIGMLLMVLRIANGTSGINDNTLNLAFYNLFPVFIGGATGIFVFGSGMMLLDKLEQYQLIAENELLVAFIKFESEQGISRPKNLEDAYNQLLKPLTELITKLKSINNGFDKFSNEAKNLVDVYSQKTTDFIHKINDTTANLSLKINSNSESLEKTTQNISSWNSLFSESAKQWKESATSLSLFSNSLAGIEERLKKMTIISQDITGLVKNMNDNSTKINELVNWVEKDRLEFSSLKDEVKKFINTIPKFIDGVEQFKLGLSPLEDKFNNRLLEVNKNLGELLISSQSEYQKAFLEQIKEMSNELKQVHNLDMTKNLTDVLNKLQVYLSKYHNELLDQPQEININLEKIANGGEPIYDDKIQAIANNDEGVSEKSSFIKKILGKFKITRV